MSDFIFFDDDAILSLDGIDDFIEKFDIQTASFHDLIALGFLSQIDVERILIYRESSPIIDANSLIVAGLSVEIAELLSEYIVYTHPHTSAQHIDRDSFTLSHPRRKIRYTLDSFHLYQEHRENFRTSQRFRADLPTYQIRLYHETNTLYRYGKYHFGGSLTYQRPGVQDRLVAGQYQISHAYGLHIGSGSFISQKPGFDTNYQPIRTRLIASPRRYHSFSLFGMAYQKSLSENFSLLVYTSLKETGARLAGGQIVSMLPGEANPTETATHSLSGSIFTYQNKGLTLSSAMQLSLTDRDMVESVKPLSFSASCSYQKNEYLLFSETALSDDLLANTTGIKYRQQRFSHIVSFRYFQPHYQQDYADYLSNFSTQENEFGIFYRVAYRQQGYSLTSFADKFSHIENHRRYADKVSGMAWGLRGEKFALFGVPDMSIALSYREKYDKEWRNFIGYARYEERKREYYKVSWTQCDTKLLTVKMNYHYQKRYYIEHDISDDGYAIGSQIDMRFQHLRVSFLSGIFDSDIPMYMFLYSGRLRNQLYVLNGDGQYALLRVNSQISRDWQIEISSAMLKKSSVEHTVSLLIRYTN
jgi:hypothetical protein